jgi:hypothetical protein
MSFPACARPGNKNSGKSFLKQMADTVLDADKALASLIV